MLTGLRCAKFLSEDKAFQSDWSKHSIKWNVVLYNLLDAPHYVDEWASRSTLHNSIASRVFKLH